MVFISKDNLQIIEDDNLIQQIWNMYYVLLLLLCFLYRVSLKNVHLVNLVHSVFSCFLGIHNLYGERFFINFLLTCLLYTGCFSYSDQYLRLSDVHYNVFYVLFSSSTCSTCMSAKIYFNLFI